MRYLRLLTLLGQQRKMSKSDLAIEGTLSRNGRLLLLSRTLDTFVSIIGENRFGAANLASRDRPGLPWNESPERDEQFLVTKGAMS